MKLSVYLSDGGTLEIEDFDADTALDLKGEMEDGPQFLTFEMGDDTVLVNRAHVVRIDFDYGQGGNQ